MPLILAMHMDIRSPRCHDAMTQPQYHADECSPAGVAASATRVIVNLMDLIEPLAPSDHVKLEDALTGLKRCLLAAQREGVVTHAVDFTTSHEPMPTSPPIGSLAREGRAVKFATYWLLGRIGGCTFGKGRSAAQLALATLGTRVLSTALGANAPTHVAIKSLERCIFGSGDSTPTQTQRLDHAKRELGAATVGNQTAATRLGLIPSVPKAARTVDQKFNARLYRRRLHYASKTTYAATAGARNHNALTEHQLRQVGTQIRARLSTDTNCLYLALSIETGLLPGDLAFLPIDKSPTTARTSAWLDIEAGQYIEQLPALERGGKKPTKGTESLYTPSQSQLRKPLSSECAGELQKRYRKHPARRIMDLLGPYTLSPHASPLDLDPLGAVTPRRILTALHRPLLDRQCDRYTVSLVTGRRDLVPEHRLYYGTVASNQIDSVCRLVHEIFGWTTPVSAQKHSYIGSAVEPTDEALTQAWRFLKADIECNYAERRSKRSLIGALNTANALLAFGLALALALRETRTYQISIAQMFSRFTSFCDKHVVANPQRLAINDLARSYIIQWQKICHETIDALHAEHAPEAILISNYLRDGAAYAIFEVRAGLIYPAGDEIWRSRLPKTHRLRPNFGRHYWPRRLGENGISHRAIEMLLRHHGGVFHVSETCATSNDDEVRAMSKIMMTTARRLDIASLKPSRRQS